MSDEEEEISLHGPNCECSDVNSEEEDEDDSEDDDEEPRAKRQRISSPDPEPNNNIDVPGPSGRFSPGDYLSSSDSEKIIEAVEQAELARTLQGPKGTASHPLVVSDWDDDDDESPRATAAGHEEEVESGHSRQSTSVRRRRRSRESPIPLPIGGDFGDSSSISSLESFVDPDVEIDSGSNTWMISSPLNNNGSGSSVHWSNSPPDDTNPDDRVYDLEFEVASVSESELNQNPIEDANSSSGLDERVDLHLPMLANVGGSLLEEKDRDADNSAEEDSDSSVKTEKSDRNGPSSDSELSEKDKWPCYQCKTMTCALSRYCLRCFRTRRNWLPKRPKSRKAKARHRASNILNVHSSDSTEDEEQAQGQNGTLDRVAFSVISSAQQQGVDPLSSSKSLFFNNPESIVPSCTASTPLPPSSFQDNTPPTSNPNSQLSVSHSSSDGSLLKTDSFTTPKSMLQLNTKLNTINTCQTKESISKGLQSVNTTTNNNTLNNSGTNSSLQEEELSESQTSHASVELASSPSSLPPPSSTIVKQNNNMKTQQETPMCTVCCLREKDAAFVHNKIAHHCCCFTCADKILKKTGKCPICRERILRVVKIISV